MNYTVKLLNILYWKSELEYCHKRYFGAVNPSIGPLRSYYIDL